MNASSLLRAFWVAKLGSDVVHTRISGVESQQSSPVSVLPRLRAAHLKRLMIDAIVVPGWTRLQVGCWLSHCCSGYVDTHGLCSTNTCTFQPLRHNLRNIITHGGVASQPLYALLAKTCLLEVAWALGCRWRTLDASILQHGNYSKRHLSTARALWLNLRIFGCYDDRSTNACAACHRFFEVAGQKAKPFACCV